MPAMTKALMGRRSHMADDLKRELGDYLRTLRERRGMTQAELAKAVGMTYYTAISAVETGRNVVPVERLLEFAEALGVNPRTFAKEVLRMTNPWVYALLFHREPKPEWERINAGLPPRVTLDE